MLDKKRITPSNSGLREARDECPCFTVGADKELGQLKRNGRKHKEPIEFIEILEKVLRKKQEPGA